MAQTGVQRSKAAPRLDGSNQIGDGGDFRVLGGWRGDSLTQADHAVAFEYGGFDLGAAQIYAQPRHGAFLT